MKIQMITIAALTTLLALTGCESGNSVTENSNAGNGGKSEVTTATRTTAETKAATDTAVTAKSAKETVTEAAAEQSEGNVRLGEPIFGGYVTADTAVKSKPDTGSDTLITIPSDTQIGVHESGKDRRFCLHINKLTIAKSVGL